MTDTSSPRYSQRGAQSAIKWVGVAAQLRQRCREVGVGNRLPAFDQLMDELNVSRSTLQNALTYLAGQGEAKQNSWKGYVVVRVVDDDSSR